MSMPYVLSYDLGTSGVKATLVDTNGNIVGDAIENYPLYMPQASWAEQDPEDYWKAVCAATKCVLAKTGADANDAKGMAFCSQWKGIIPIDKDYNVLHRSILWLDARADKQAKRVNKLLKISYYMEKYFGTKPSSKLNAALGKEVLCGADYWPKLMWFREELPEIYEKTAYILEANSFVKWRATDEMASDMTNHFTKSFNSSSQQFYSFFLKYAKIDPNLFPKIVLPTELVGYVTEEAAVQMGLVPGIPVFGGCGDIPAIAVGSGCSNIGDTHAYFGSSGWLASMVPCKEGFKMTSPFSKENDLLCFGLQAIGLSFDWTVKQLYHAELKEFKDDIYQFIDKELADVPPGSLELLASHWIFGERPPFFSDKARGVFVNLNSQHDRRHMLNAMMESVCYSMRMGLDALQAGRKCRVNSIQVSGGGACNDHWMQMLADILEIPVLVPKNPRQAGAIGTAYCALIGLGLCRDLDEAKSHISIEKKFLPREDTKKAYDKTYKAYTRLYPELKNLFISLN